MPEVDSPGHNNAIIMSEYGDTANPRLRHPQDINCGLQPAAWDYTEDVGYSAMCPGSQNTWAIMSAIIGQLAALSPGPFYDVGGDEVPADVLSQSGYASFINTEAGIVHARGKTLMGWADIAGPGTRVRRGSVAEYWQPASGITGPAGSGQEGHERRHGARQPRLPGPEIPRRPARSRAAGARPDLGLPGGCDLNRAYDWDPGRLIGGVTDRNVIGVEGAVWSRRW